MISSYIKQKIESSFAKKEYQEVIDISDKFIEKKERPPGLACLIGTCKFLKKEKNLEDLKSALDYFEEAYEKDKVGIHGLSGITNYINTSVFGAKRYNQLSIYLNKAEKYYNETKDNFEKNIDFIIASKRLFSYQLDKFHQKKISEKILINPKFPLSEKMDSIFLQNYVFGWSQKKYTDQIKILSKNLPMYNAKNLSEIKLDENKKIHVGFISADFTDQHSIFYFLRDTLKYMNRDIFKIYLFSFNKGQNNEIIGQGEIKSVADEFIDLEKYDNQECIDVIQKKKINILIDLLGITSIERISLFTARIAPVQISWLSNCNTNGIENIDYMIADQNVISKNEEELYPEKIIKMPEIWNSHCGYTFERKLQESPCKKNDYFTFGCLNNFHKISDEVIEAWGKILQKCENSKLILKSSSFNCNTEKIKHKFKKFGVEHKVDLLDTKKYADKNDHINVYKSIDLALDTFPYNGVTTTFESLWMGVPVIVLKGFNFNSKCGYSIIKNSGYPDLISNSIEEYVKKAVYFYNNQDDFLKIKSDLSNKILLTPLFKTKKFSENFSNLLLKVNKN